MKLMCLLIECVSMYGTIMQLINKCIELQLFNVMSFELANQMWLCH